MIVAAVEKEDRIALPEHGRKLASAIPGVRHEEARIVVSHRYDREHETATRVRVGRP
jgi:hypothetical protein